MPKLEDELEQVAGECAALLATLELAAEESSTSENQSHDTASSVNEPDSVQDGDQQSPERQEEDLSEPQAMQENTAVERCDTLTHELASFADELQTLVSHLGASDTREDAHETLPATPPPATSSNHEESSTKLATPLETFSSAATDGSSEAATISSAIAAEHKPQRTSLLDKTLSKRKLRRGLAPTRPLFPQAKSPVIPRKPRSEGADRRLWSRFQSSSVLRHITRQQQARLRVAQAQAAQRRVEAARAKPATKSARSQRPSKQRHDEPRASYLRHFWAERGQTPASASACSPASLEGPVEPQFLCAVYLHGHRRLGTAFVTFTSLAQLEARVRAMFSLDAVASIYRVKPDVNHTDHTGRGRGRPGRRDKILQRVTSLEQLGDGDTLCVTQDAYEDMSLLCQWMKRRQRTLYHFQHEPQPATTTTATRTSTKDEPREPQHTQRPIRTRQQPLWDANGRSVGVKTQLPIR